MLKHSMYCFYLLCILVCYTCSNKANHYGQYENIRWELVEINHAGENIEIGDLLEFNKASQTCNWGKNKNLSYYTNDSLLLVNHDQTQRIFTITINTSSIQLEELYTSDNKTFTFKAFSN